jgi:hypothetical protein
MELFKEGKEKMKPKNVPFKTNKFYVDAEYYRTHLTEEDEIMKINYTKDFYEEIENMVRQNEIIIGNINAKMRLGKSTLAMALGKHTFQLIQKYNFRNKKENFGMKNIARDQQEKSKMMRDPELCYTCIVTDESNELEEGGENATAEFALKKVFSDVQAGRYVHGWSCSPKETVDSNADIMLSVVAINKQTKTTRSKLYYRYYEGGSETTQLLGYVDVYVGDIIEKWDSEIKNIFLKPKKTQAEKELIEAVAKEDFYVEYMIKKYEKMELITKHGIMRPRVLDYAEVIQNVIGRLIPLTRHASILNDKIVRNYVKMEMQKAKIPTSIVGIHLASQEASGVIDLYKSFYKLVNRIDKIQPLLNNHKKRDEWKRLGSELSGLERMRDELMNAIQIQQEEYSMMVQLNKDYNKHWENTKVKENKK